MSNGEFTKEEEKRLKLKIRSYYSQDMKSGKIRYNDKYNCYNAHELTLGDISGIISKQGLACYYCREMTQICPSRNRAHNQFTLDRIDNNSPHTVPNCLVCCYSCNVDRSNDYTSEEYRARKA